MNKYLLVLSKRVLKGFCLRLEPIIILDFDDQVSTLNEKARKLLKIPVDKAIGSNIMKVLSPVFGDLHAFKEGEVKLLKSCSFGQYRILKSHFMNQRFRRSFLMIEELTTEILQAEKRAYGKVIPMMAHEVNNTLGATDSILQTTFRISRNFPKHERHCKLLLKETIA